MQKKTSYKRALFAFVIVLTVFAWSSLGQEAPSTSTTTFPPIKVNVSLVTLTATVFDRSDLAVSGLNKEDFSIYEDGVPQDIAVFQREDVPVSVGILFDTSGSMVDKIDEVGDAVNHLIDKANPEDEFFIMQFSTEAFLVRGFTSDRKPLRNAIGRLHARGSTSLYEAIVKGLEHARTGRHRKKALVVVTDGNDTSSKITFTEGIGAARRSEVLIYCLGIGDGEQGSFGHAEGAFKDTVDADALLAFSDATGGKTFLLQGAHFKRGVDQIDQAARQVAAELRSQYELGYPDQQQKGWNLQTHPGSGETRERHRTGTARILCTMIGNGRVETCLERQMVLGGAM